MCALLLLGIAGTLAPAATAGAQRFPVPSCGWAPAGLISRALGDPVRGLKPSWSTQIAPVLSCGFVERRRKLQLGGASLVVVEFREQQLVRPPSGAVSVPGLGSCIPIRTCPKAGKPAWLYELTTFGVQGNSRYAVRFTKLAALEVQDGFNEITILVANPDGPLPVANEAHALERLARALAPHFYYA
jgi:hypothetical protein